MTDSLLQLDHVSMSFAIGRHQSVQALRDVSFVLESGKTLGLVGESGCGKSTLARIVMGVHKPTKGRILFQGEELNVRRHADRLAYARKSQMIFQDPFSSLDPRMTVEDIVAENLDIQKHMNKKERHQRVCELLEMVGLPTQSTHRFPHEFSGGQRQRIGIARALCVSPQLLVCDEPTSALDISVQSQIINLLSDLRQGLGLSYLFISHNLSVVRALSDTIAVMYKGMVVECAPAQELYQNPLHPYTNMLLDAMLEADPTRARVLEVDSSQREAGILVERNGCLFAPRCPQFSAECGGDQPALREVSSQHFAACRQSCESLMMEEYNSQRAL